MPDHFSRIADRYAAYRPHYPAEFVELLAAHAPARELAWDVGCGSGQLTIALADHFARVHATDLAQKQLDAAPPHPRITYRCAPAETSGLADASVDLVVAAQAAHWFEFSKWLAETGRVARRGALVAIASYGKPCFEGDEDVRHFHDVALDAYWPPGREHVDNGYRDLHLPWTPIAAPEIEMAMQWTRDELVGYLSSWSAVARLSEREGRAKFEALCRRLEQRWPDEERRTVHWPLAIRLARR